jgi:hypothetical protein
MAPQRCLCARCFFVAPGGALHLHRLLLLPSGGSHTPCQVGVNAYQNYAFIREFTSRPVSVLEASAGCAAKGVNDLDAGLVVLVTNDPQYVNYVCKYRPRVSGPVCSPSTQKGRDVEYQCACRQRYRLCIEGLACWPFETPWRRPCTSAFPSPAHAPSPPPTYTPIYTFAPRGRCRSWW